VLGDLGCHIYDMAAFVCGPIAEIDCRLATFPKGVKGERVGPYRLDANDSFVSTVRFSGGALGTVSASRWASGHRNREYLVVFGDRGAVEVDFERGLDVYRLATNQTPRRRTGRKCAPSRCRPCTPGSCGRYAQGARTSPTSRTACACSPTLTRRSLARGARTGAGRRAALTGRIRDLIILGTTVHARRWPISSSA